MLMKRIKTGLIGGAGYTGGELIRLLLNHPNVEINFIHSKSNSRKPVTSVHTDLIGETDLKFSGELSTEIDVLFLCAGHGEAQKFLEDNHINDRVNTIDLSQDFRLHHKSEFGNR